MSQILNLLIAEDNEPDVFLIRESLRGAGLEFEAQVAYNGEKAIALIDQSALSADKRFHGMILDLNLTTHSGFEILSHARSIPALAGVLIVILTSSDSPEDRRQAEMLGTDGFFRKPFGLSEFMRLGEELAQLFRLGKTGPSQSA